MPGPKDLVRMRHNNVVIDIVVAVLVLALVRVIVVVSVILRSFVRSLYSSPSRRWRRSGLGQEVQVE